MGGGPSAYCREGGIDGAHRKCNNVLCAKKKLKKKASFSWKIILRGAKRSAHSYVLCADVFVIKNVVVFGVLIIAGNTI